MGYQTDEKHRKQSQEKIIKLLENLNEPTTKSYIQGLCSHNWGMSPRIVINYINWLIEAGYVTEKEGKIQLNKKTEPQTLEGDNIEQI